MLNAQPLCTRGSLAGKQGRSTVVEWGAHRVKELLVDEIPLRSFVAILLISCIKVNVYKSGVECLCTSFSKGYKFNFFHGAHKVKYLQHGRRENT